MKRMWQISCEIEKIKAQKSASETSTILSSLEASIDDEINLAVEALITKFSSANI